MMKKLLPLTALALGLSSGVALADRHGGDHRGEQHHSSAVVRDHRASVYHNNNHSTVVVRGNGNAGWNGRWHGNSRVVVNRPTYVVNRPHYVARRPIYVERPVIRHRYYNYYQRPSIIVENYGPRDGYYWVAGQWSWSGYEWIWQPGHYEPDASYSEPYYDGY